MQQTKCTYQKSSILDFLSSAMQFLIEPKNHQTICYKWIEKAWNKAFISNVWVQNSLYTTKNTALQ